MKSQQNVIELVTRPNVDRRYATSTLAQREARDAKKARAYGIPFSLREIIDSSMEKFNDLVSNSGLTDQQMTLCRDIRRRGKNKVGRHKSTSTGIMKWQGLRLEGQCLKSLL